MATDLARRRPSGSDSGGESRGAKSKVVVRAHAIWLAGMRASASTARQRYCGIGSGVQFFSDTLNPGEPS